MSVYKNCSLYTYFLASSKASVYNRLINTCMITSSRFLCGDTRGEKFDLAKICMRGKLVSNLATKFVLSLHASTFEVCDPLDLQQTCQRFARVQIHK